MVKCFKQICLGIIAIFIAVYTVSGQTATIGSKVKQTKIRNSENEPTDIPELGKKVLLIFYVDPDHSNQNKKFRENLEKNQIHSPNIFSFGIVNLKDAPLLPNGIVRSMIRSKVKQTGAQIYTDPDYSLRDAWNLGDVNDKFTLIIVDKDCKIVFLSKGELSQNQIDEFYSVINKYK